MQCGGIKVLGALKPGEVGHANFIGAGRVCGVLMAFVKRRASGGNKRLGVLDALSVVEHLFGVVQRLQSVDLVAVKNRPYSKHRKRLFFARVVLLLYEFEETNFSALLAFFYTTFGFF